MNNPLQSAYAPSKTPSQVVLTPQCVLDLVAKIWPEGIVCDPFPSIGSPATNAAGRILDDGFSQLWPSCSYANPPFNRLKEAMPLAHESAEANGEVILLGPAQTHRQWFWDYRGRVVGWLKPLAFLGHKSTYPKPLCLHWYGHEDTSWVEKHMKNSGLVRHVERRS